MQPQNNLTKVLYRYHAQKIINHLDVMLTGGARLSAWKRGVILYAIDILDDYEGDITKQAMLNGAKDWSDYSYGGCSIIYDRDIADRLCTPSAYRRKRGGELPPNRNETWLDVQARALRQAARLIIRLTKN